MKTVRDAVDQSAAGIAAAVVRSDLLTQLEDKLAEQNDLYAAVQAQLRKLIADNLSDLNDRGMVVPMKRLENSKREIEVEIDKTRAKLAPLRQGRGRAVAAALNPLKIAAAHRCRAALTELAESLRTLGEVEDGIRLAGADPGQSIGNAAGFIAHLRWSVDSIVEADSAQ